MTDALPSPLTPPDCDKRILQSSFWSRASDQACRISVDFWAKAYEQVPAASLPNDDYLLAEWAGFGRRNLGSPATIGEDWDDVWRAHRQPLNLEGATAP